MDVRSEQRVGTATIAGAVLAVKAVLGVWAGLALMTASNAHHRSFLGTTITVRRTGLGVALLVLGVAAAIVAIGLLRRLSWAAPAALVLEAVGVVLALSRIGSRPGLAA